MKGFIISLRKQAWFRGVSIGITAAVSLPVDALTTGPAQPEYQGFQPVEVGEHVDPFTGDFSYSITLADIDGVFPLTLSYSAESVVPESEASWVGWGWNLNTGGIQRTVNGIPDDANGDPFVEKTHLAPEIDFKLTAGLKVEFLGHETGNSNSSNSSGSSNSANQSSSSSLAPNFFITLMANTYRGISIGIGGGIGPISASYTTGQGAQLGINLVIPMFRAKKGSGDPFATTMGISIAPGHYSFNTAFGQIKPKDDKSQFYPIVSSSLEGVGPFAVNSSDIGSNRFGMGIGVKFGFELQGFEPLTSGDVFLAVKEFSKSPTIRQAYGYLYLHRAKNNSAAKLDFMQDNNRNFVVGTPVLSPTYLTPDMFSASGFGLDVQFRAQRRSPGTVYPSTIFNWFDDNSPQEDEDNLWKQIIKTIKSVFIKRGGEADVETSVSIEGGPGGLAKLGANIGVTISSAERGPWLEVLSKLPQFEENDVFWKPVRGGSLVDIGALQQNYNGHNEVVLSIRGSRWDVMLDGSFKPEPYYKHELEQPYSITTYTADQCRHLFTTTTVNPYARDHHIARIDIVSPSGLRYVFDKTLYQRTVDVTFRKEYTEQPNNIPFQIDYTMQDASENNKQGRDNLYTRREQPMFAYAYLPTQIIAPDYSDVNGNGPDDSDLGWWAKLSYSQLSKLYKWRNPITPYKANFSPGNLFTRLDGTANYIYGEKQIAYLKQIETPYTVVKFYTSGRLDALGVLDEYGNLDTVNKMHKLDSVVLYRKGEGGLQYPYRKIAFYTSYKLAQGTPNSIAPGGGRLTLDSVSIIEYDVYGTWKTGKQTYKFTYYGKGRRYRLNSTDRWGIWNDQVTWFSRYADTSEASRNESVRLWKLKSIEQPSGVVVEIEYESDRYRWVQDRRAMQMYQIIGFYDGSQLVESTTNIVVADVNFTSSQIQELEDELFDPIEHANGLIYLRLPVKIDRSLPYPVYEMLETFVRYVSHSWEDVDNDGLYEALIEIEYAGIDDGVSGVNPVQYAAIQFAMNSAPQVIYVGLDQGINMFITSDDPFSLLLNSFRSAITTIAQTLLDFVAIILANNNFIRYLANMGVGKRCLITSDAVIRLGAIGQRLGGGARVKRIVYRDVWEGHAIRHEIRYIYGPGVASFEPTSGHEESPFALPVFYERYQRGGLASVLDNWGIVSNPDLFIMEPVGISSFPAPSVGYQWTIVKHVTPQGVPSTGWSKYEYYTYKDFPVKESFSPINYGSEGDFLATFIHSTVNNQTFYSYTIPPPLAPILLYWNGGQVIGVSQGFIFETHNMHGKMRRKQVFDGAGRLIAEEIYSYKRGTDGTTFALPTGQKNTLASGTDMDFVVYVDYFRSQTVYTQVNLNAAATLFPLLVSPYVSGKFHIQKQKLYLVTTTKRLYYHYYVDKVVVRKYTQRGEQKSYVYDLITGEPLVNKTYTEGMGQPTYSVKYPAYWFYPELGPAHGSEGTEFIITTNSNGVLNTGYIVNPISDVWYFDPRPLVEGDILYFPDLYKKAWVVEDETTGKLALVDRNGDPMIVSGKKAIRIRSGRKNMLSLTVANIQSLSISNGMFLEVPNDSLLSVSLTTYSDRWQMPCTRQCSLSINPTDTVTLKWNWTAGGLKVSGYHNPDYLIYDHSAYSATTKDRYSVWGVDNSVNDGPRAEATLFPSDSLSMVVFLGPRHYRYSMIIGKTIVGSGTMTMDGVFVNGVRWHDVHIAQYNKKKFLLTTGRHYDSIYSAPDTAWTCSIQTYELNDFLRVFKYLALNDSICLKDLIKELERLLDRLDVPRLETKEDTVKWLYKELLRYLDECNGRCFIDVPMHRQIVRPASLQSVDSTDIVALWEITDSIHLAWVSRLDGHDWHIQAFRINDGVATWVIKKANSSSYLVGTHSISPLVKIGVWKLTLSGNVSDALWQWTKTNTGRQPKLLILRSLGNYVYLYEFDGNSWVRRRTYVRSLNSNIVVFTKWEGAWRIAWTTNGKTTSSSYLYLGHIPQIGSTQAIKLTVSEPIELKYSSGQGWFPFLLAKHKQDSSLIIIKVDTSEWACPKSVLSRQWSSYSIGPFQMFFKDTLLSYHVDSLQWRDIGMGLVGQVNTICSCEDEVTVVIRHPEACCSGTLFVQNGKKITLKKHTSNGLVEIGTGSIFTNLCPGLYRVFAGQGNCGNFADIAIDASVLCSAPNAGRVNPYIVGIRGRWLVDKQWVFPDERKPLNISQIPNIRTAGILNRTINPIRRYGNRLIIDTNGWMAASEVTQMGLWGEPIEERNILGLYNSALFGYKRRQPVMVSANARYRDILFTSFEETTVLEDHLDFSSAQVQSLKITEEFFHTGHHSLRLDQGDLFMVGGWQIARQCGNDLPRTVPFAASGCDCMDNFTPSPGQYYLYAWVKWPIDTLDLVACKPPQCLIDKPKPPPMARTMNPQTSPRQLGTSLEQKQHNRQIGKCWTQLVWSNRQGMICIQKCCKEKLYKDIDPQVKLQVSWPGYSQTLEPEHISNSIEGWRLYRWKVNVPDSCGKFHMYLYGDAGKSWWLDDIRFEPAGSKGTTFTYEGEYIRLVARFNEVHAPTLYRYDERGQLSSVLHKIERALLGISHQRMDLKAK